MERSEPALVPEWLKVCNGGISSGGSSLHHSSIVLPSDDHHAPTPTKIRLSINSGDQDNSRSSGIPDKASAAHFRRSSSSNGSIAHDKDRTSFSRSYNSFGRSHRDKDREKNQDKEWLPSGDTDSFGLVTRIDKDSLRRSRSMISGKKNEVWPKRIGCDMSIGRNSNVGVTHINRTAFDRDFPSLIAEEKPVTPDIGRVASPGLTTVSQSLPMGSSTVIGGDGWTSALAEVPVIIGGNSTVISSLPPNVPVSSAMPPPCTNTGLNMAETLAQAPSRTRTTPHLSVETQRLEELAIKQSRQLIPMTPSMPKTSALSLSEKPKSKSRANEAAMTPSKTGPQVAACQYINHALRGSGKCDTAGFLSATSSKLLVLKCHEKNGICLAATSHAKESATNFPSAARHSDGVASAPVHSGLSKGPNHVKPKTLISPAVERKIPIQAQGRNDFFNSLRKKVTPVAVGNSTASSILEKSELKMLENSSVHNQEKKDATTTSPALEWASSENGDSHMSSSTDGHEALSNGMKNLGLDEVVDPDEEEARFLRSLGWEENAGQDEALTEEEIKAFYEEYIKLRPSAKVYPGLQKLRAGTLVPNNSNDPTLLTSDEQLGR